MGWSWNPFTGQLDKTGGGGAAAPINATYITQTLNSTLTAEQALASLATGILKNTTTTGILSIALADTDYLTPTTAASTYLASATAATTYLKIDTSNDPFTGILTGPQYVSTIAIGTAPYACTSTTVNTNLNADLLDAAHVGTSGAAIGLLNAANTWSATQSSSANPVLAMTSTTTGIRYYLVTVKNDADTGICWINSGTMDDFDCYQILFDNTLALAISRGADASGGDTKVWGTFDAYKGVTLGSAGTGILDFVLKDNQNQSLGIRDTSSNYYFMIDTRDTVEDIEFGNATLNPTFTFNGTGAITGTRWVSTVAIGTSPYTCTSTTLNTNLNADLWDGYQFSDYIDQAVKTTSSPTFANMYVANGGKVGYEGSAGDTYTRYNSTTEKLEFYVDNVLKLEV